MRAESKSTRCGARYTTFGLIAGLVACGESAEIVHPVPLRSALRPTSDDAVTFGRFLSSDIVETLDSDDGRFRVHYTRSGINRVPDLDRDDSSVPDYAEQALEVLEDALAHYVDDLGFPPPLNDAAANDDGGSAALDLYLVDFGGIASGQFVADACLGTTPERCSGFLAMDNDFLGYSFATPFDAVRIVASHELFHALQAAYTTEIDATLSEGTAVWATESFDGSLNDFESFLPGYFLDPSRSLESGSAGPVSPFSYGSAIWWQFLNERHDGGIPREVLEALGSGASSSWLQATDQALRSRSSSFETEWIAFASWVFFTGRRGADAESFADATRYPEVAVRDESLPFENTGLRLFPASLRYFDLGVPAGSTLELRLTPRSEEDLAPVFALAFALRNGRWSPASASGTPDALRFDVADAERAVVAIGNHSIDNESRRPALCLGSPSAACDPGTTTDPSTPIENDASGGCQTSVAFPLALTALRRRRRRRSASGAMLPN